MNVLLFTMVLVFVMTILSYTRLETFRNFIGLQQLFKNYMEVVERDYPNKMAEERYNTQRKRLRNVVEASDEDKAKNAPSSNARISLYYLVRPEEREKSDQAQEVFQQQEYLTKKLMRQLYADQPFFQEAENALGPQFLDTLIQAIADAAGRLPKEQKIARTEKLGNLQLSNPTLDQVFYKMLRGAPELQAFGYVDSKSKERLLDPMTPIFEKEAGEEGPALKEEDNEEDNKADENEYQDVTGYQSFLPSVTVKKGTRIRVWLATPELLRAIYGEEIAGQILAVRQQYYRQLMREEIKAEEIEQNLKAQFDSARDPYLNSSFLDYRATKTNPNR